MKLANFMNKNKFAPVMVTLKVVKACINSALTYGCETWGNYPLNNIEVLQREVLQRKALKNNTKYSKEYA